LTVSVSSTRRDQDAVALRYLADPLSNSAPPRSAVADRSLDTRADRARA
jgi:hypothetical protein